MTATLSLLSGITHGLVAAERAAARNIMVLSLSGLLPAVPLLSDKPVPEHKGSIFNSPAALDSTGNVLGVVVTTLPALILPVSSYGTVRQMIAGAVVLAAPGWSVTGCVDEMASEA